MTLVANLVGYEYRQINAGLHGSFVNRSKANTVEFIIDSTKPAPDAKGDPLYPIERQRYNLEQGQTLWGRSVSGVVQIGVIEGLLPNEESGDLDRRMSNGVGAYIIQAYPEVNKKRGLEWEASRVVAADNVGDKFYSVLKVGSEYIDLKAREIGGTGGGAYGRAYKIQASDVTLNTPDKWYNFHSSMFGQQPETEIYAGSEITFNTVSGTAAELAVEANKITADINAITNIQNQGKGVPVRPFGGNHIYEPGEYILLELESYDATQDISARLEVYEGPLDFYPVTP
ncbi:hypothetical protein PP409_gp37 [Vibrio phage Seahorse]|uniref:Uncharacterized protein n=1 Tax=Vibrio phage Seahorse TaxID=2662136 RepID=A0A6B7SF40_9CAUD|nr:hypothetical protein PP409_gp37 [Vibrio phage Seahorse]QGF20988.1 hypothetical protein [Vibrio phage Seahorse]